MLQVVKTVMLILYVKKKAKRLSTVTSGDCEGKA